MVRLRNAMDLKEPVKLYNEREKKINALEASHFEERGQLIEHLPPCLDPDIADAKKTTDEMMAQRIVDTPQIQILMNPDVTLEEILDNRPACLNFFPSAETQRRLFDRMCKLKEKTLERQLW